MHTGCLLATSDNEIGKIGPSPAGCGENPGVPSDGLWSLGWKSGHTLFSPSTLEPPKPAGSASSGPIFARNAIHPGSLNRP